MEHPMGAATHVYCDTCEKIQLAVQEPLVMIDDTGRFVGGDILCSACTSIIATMYREMTDEERAEPELEFNG